MSRLSECSKFRLTVLCLVFLGGSLALGCSARNPRSVVQEITTRLKTKGDPVVVLNYVHWETAYANLSPAQRNKLSIKSAEGARDYFHRLFENPSALLERQLENNSRQQQVNPEQQARTKEVTLSLFRKTQARQKARFKDTDYKIERVQVDGDKALVTVVSEYQGQLKSTIVELRKIGNNWYLPTINLVYESSR